MSHLRRVLIGVSVAGTILAAGTQASATASPPGVTGPTLPSAARSPSSTNTANDWGSVSAAPVPVSYSLASVSADSPTDIWAVGQRQRKKIVQTFIEHGDGTTWTTVADVNPGPRNSLLSAVDALSPTDAWAVGSYRRAATDHTLIEHWDGTAWQQVPSPEGDLPDSELMAVDVLSPTDIWAVGQTHDQTYYEQSSLIEHWNGHDWSIVQAAPHLKWAVQALTAVKVISATDVWAVGYGMTDPEAGDLPFSEHWNGKTWHYIKVEHGSRFGYYYLRAIDATSATDVWAIGDQERSYDYETTMIEHWTDGPWGTVDAPNPGVGRGTYLNGVAAQSATNVWTVGEYDNGTSLHALVLNWDGSSWTQVPAPSPGGRFDTTLTAVSSDSADDAWAVGFLDKVFKKRPIIEHWDGTAWSVAQKGLG